MPNNVLSDLPNSLVIEVIDRWQSVIIDVVSTDGVADNPNTERGFLTAEDKLVINMMGETDRARIAASNKISDALKTFNVNQSSARLANEVNKAVGKYGKTIANKLPDVIEKSSREMASKLGGDWGDKVARLNRNNDKYLKDYYSGPAQDRVKETIARVIETVPSEEWEIALNASLTRLIESDLSEYYFRLTAINSLNRTRSYVNLLNYREQGIKYAVVRAVLDRKTTQFCRSIDGTVISVEKSIESLELSSNAESTEELDKLNPWHTSGVVPKDIGAPPYHGHCRTRIEMVSEL